MELTMESLVERGFLYDKTLRQMAATVHDWTALVPEPQKQTYKDSFVFRYIEKSVLQAVIQKLARLVSGLHAARLLMEEGFVQEQAALQRMLDEITEDISFLSFSVISGELTPVHEAFLNAFFLEEFQDDDAATSSNRPAVPRQKIRAYIDRITSGKKGSNVHLEASRTVSKAYSGYVHAASPQIMDMYGGNPPRFFMSGLKGTQRHAEHRADLWNYFYRGVLSFAFAAKAFDDDDAFVFYRDLEVEFSTSYNRS